MCLLPAAISCSVHAVPADPLPPREQPGSREVRAEQVSRRLHTFTPAFGSGRRASFSVTGAKSVLENPIKALSVGCAHMAAPFLALSPARSPARRCRVLLRGMQLPGSCISLLSPLRCCQPGRPPALSHSQLPTAAAPPPLQTIVPHPAGAPGSVM